MLPGQVLPAEAASAQEHGAGPMRSCAHLRRHTSGDGVDFRIGKVLDIVEALLYATNYVDDPTEHNSVYGLLRRLYARQDVFWHGEARPNRLRP